jgi:DNA-binding NtrC family response regulator
MKGNEVAGEIRKIDQTISSIVSNGYSDDPILSDPTAHGFCDSLGKPFTCSESASALARNI